MPASDVLTPREREILHQIARGYSNRQIAESMTIAPTTVKWFRRQIYNKLGANSREEALKQAIRGQIIAPHSVALQTLRLPHTFIGRVHERQQIARWLAQDSTRLVSIVGLGGVGKTWLAQKIAQELGAAYAFGAVFIELASVQQADRVPAAIMAGLRLQRFFESLPPQAELVRLLDHPLLLVLDNVEQITNVEVFVADLLRRTSRLKLILTSRATLNIQGEKVLHLGGLEIDSRSRVGQSEGEQLFVELARRSRPDFLINADATDHIRAIVRATDGLPLAIQMIAAWVRALPLRYLADETQKGLALYTTTQKDMPARQQSIGALFDHTWNLLPTDVQATCAALSVFAGGCGFEAAVIVAGATPSILATLVDYCWLSVDAAGRYHLHRLIRQYAAEQLDISYDADRYRDAHAHYFTGWLAERRATLRHGGADVDAIFVELENIQAAFDRATSAGHWSLLLPLLLATLWLYDGLDAHADGSRLGSEALQATRQSQDEAQRHAHFAALIVYGWSQHRLDQSSVALACALDACHLLADIPHDSYTAELLTAAALIIANSGGDLAQALDCLEQAQVIFARVGEAWGVAECHSDMGLVCNYMGQPERAYQHLKQAHGYYQQAQDTRGITICYAQAAIGLLQRQQVDESVAYANTSLRFAHQSAYPALIDMVTALVIQIALVQSNYPRAVQAQKAIIIYYGLRESVQRALTHGLALAELLDQAGDADEAVQTAASILRHPQASADTCQQAQAFLNARPTRPATVRRPLLGFI